MLGSAMLDTSFASKLAVLKGRQMLDTPVATREAAVLRRQTLGTPVANQEARNNDGVQVFCQPKLANGVSSSPVETTEAARLSSDVNLMPVGIDVTVAQAKAKEGNIVKEILPVEEVSSRSAEPTVSGLSQLVAGTVAESKEVKSTTTAPQARFEALETKMQIMHETNVRMESRLQRLDSKLDSFMTAIANHLGVTEKIGEHLSRTE